MAASPPEVAYIQVTCCHSFWAKKPPSSYPSLDHAIVSYGDSLIPSVITAEPALPDDILKVLGRHHTAEYIRGRGSQGECIRSAFSSLASVVIGELQVNLWCVVNCAAYKQQFKATTHTDVYVVESLLIGLLISCLPTLWYSFACTFLHQYLCLSY